MIGSCASLAKIEDPLSFAEACGFDTQAHDDGVCGFTKSGSWKCVLIGASFVSAHEVGSWGRWGLGTFATTFRQ